MTAVESHVDFSGDTEHTANIANKAPYSSNKNNKKHLKKLMSADKTKILTNLEHILPGHFSYTIALNASNIVDLCLLFDCDLFSTSKSVDFASQNADILSLLNVDLRSVESRLRDGLPFLVPSVASQAVSEGVKSGGKLLKLTYKYTDKSNLSEGGGVVLGNVETAH